nr:MAG TPA: hypothetical protein [Caudoviricetes sp.]
MTSPPRRTGASMSRGMCYLIGGTFKLSHPGSCVNNKSHNYEEGGA